MLKRDRLKKSLLNDRGRISIFETDESVRDEVEYEGAPSGKSLARTTGGLWVWSGVATAGKENGVDALAREDDTEDHAIEQSDQNFPGTFLEMMSVVQLRRAGRFLSRLRMFVNFQKGLASVFRKSCRFLSAYSEENVMYLAGSGIQIILSSGHRKIFKIGERIQVSGVLSESGGETRIRLTKKDYVRPLGTGEPPKSLMKFPSATSVRSWKGGWSPSVARLLKNARKVYPF